MVCVSGAARGGTDVSMGGKHGAMMSMGSHGFGTASSKGAVYPATQLAAPGGFTAAELKQHTATMQAQQGHKVGGRAQEQDSLARFLAEQPTVVSMLQPEPEPEPKPAD